MTTKSGSGLGAMLTEFKSMKADMASMMCEMQQLKQLLQSGLGVIQQRQDETFEAFRKDLGIIKDALMVEEESEENTNTGEERTGEQSPNESSPTRRNVIQHQNTPSVSGQSTGGDDLSLMIVKEENDEETAITDHSDLLNLLKNIDDTKTPPVCSVPNSTRKRKFSPDLPSTSYGNQLTPQDPAPMVFTKEGLFEPNHQSSIPMFVEEEGLSDVQKEFMIGLIRDEECIWQSNWAGSREKTVLEHRCAAWERISEKFAAYYERLTVDELKRVWKNLQSAYSRSKNDMRAKLLRNGGIPPNELQMMSTYKYGKSMCFLDDRRRSGLIGKKSAPRVTGNPSSTNFYENGEQ